MQNPFKNLRQGLPPEVARDLKVRLLLLAVLGVSVALAWWSINRLPTWQRKLDQQNAQVSELESDILKLDLRWNAQEAEQIAGRFTNSYEQLLAGRDEFAGWQADLKKQADQFTLSLIPGVIKTQDCPLPGKRFAVISTTVDVRPITAGVRTNSPYLRLLNLTQNLTSRKKRVDLVELTAGGGSNSVSQATLALDLWSLENLQ